MAVPSVYDRAKISAHFNGVTKGNTMSTGGMIGAKLDTIIMAGSIARHLRENRACDADTQKEAEE